MAFLTDSNALKAGLAKTHNTYFITKSSEKLWMKQLVNFISSVNLSVLTYNCKLSIEFISWSNNYQCYIWICWHTSLHTCNKHLSVSDELVVATSSVVLRKNCITKVGVLLRIMLHLQLCLVRWYYSSLIFIEIVFSHYRISRITVLSSNLPTETIFQVRSSVTTQYYEYKIDVINYWSI